MTTTKGFDKYKVRIQGSSTTDRVALLLCFSGDGFVGRIDFFPDGADIPQDRLWHPTPAKESVVLAMPMSRFDAVMSTVRQEKPLHLYIDVDRGTGASTQGHGQLSTTDKEPVGEEEGGP